MYRRAIQLILALVILFDICLNAYAYEKKKGRPAPLVEVKKAKVENINNRIKLVGTVIESRRSRVSSQVSGLVKSVKVMEGQKVSKGSPLAVLENSQLIISITEAKAFLDEVKQKLFMLKRGARHGELEQLKAKAKEAKIIWEKKKQELQRVGDLYKKKILSENEYMNILLEADALKQAYIQKKEEYLLLSSGARKEEIAIQEAKVRTRRSQIDFLLDKEKNMTIRAPFQGIVVKKFVEEGEWITQGSQVVELIDIDPIRIEINVPEDIIFFLKQGDEAYIEVDSLPEKIFKGEVSEIIPQASISSRTFPVRIVLKNNNLLFKSGMTAKVTLLFGDKRTTIIIPQDALVMKGADTFVYSVGEKNKIKKVPVKTGDFLNGWVEATGSIKEDDLVVIKGNERLRDGMTVRLNKSMRP